MKFSRPLPLFVLVASTVLCSGGISYGKENQSAPVQSSRLMGHAAAYGVLSEDLQARMGFTCATDKDGNVVVSAVRQGMSASKGKIEARDVVLKAEMESNVLVLTVRRSGRILKARLRNFATGHPVLSAQAPKVDQTPTKPFTLNAEKSVLNDVDNQAARKAAELSTSQFNLRINQGFKLLADYDIELIVDRSMSMHKQDCPGGLSRWQWLGMQSQNLANSLAPYAQSGLTVVPFASEYDVFEHAKAGDIEQIFNGVGQQFGTRLFEPLVERLDHFFAHRTPSSKPLLIVVLTDGMPVPKFESGLVVKELIEASRNMTSAGQATVIFGQIGGDDPEGQQYLFNLDRNLTSYGARYPYVHTISFNNLQAVGLGPALVAAIQKYAPVYIPAPKQKQLTQQVTGNRIQRSQSIPQIEQWIGNRLKRVPISNADSDDSDFSDSPASDENYPSRKHDKFVDYPQLDTDGARHFQNGKYFDLNNTPVTVAIDAVKSSVLGDRHSGSQNGRRHFNRRFPHPVATGFRGGYYSGAPRPFDTVEQPQD
jgi:hypothetical protein